MTSQPITKDNHLKNLYEKDYYQWIHATINLLKEGKLEQLDRENLIEEIGDIAFKEEETIDINLRALLTELLKYKYYQSDLSGMELSKIYDYQNNIIDIIDFSPSLMEYLEEIFEENYQLAREFATIETDLPLDTFPIIAPMSATTILTENHNPNKPWNIEDLFIY